MHGSRKLSQSIAFDFGIAQGLSAPAPLRSVRISNKVCRRLSGEDKPGSVALVSPEVAAGLVDGQPYVVDCGNRVALRLARAGIPLPQIRNVYKEPVERTSPSSCLARTF